MQVCSSAAVHILLDVLCAVYFLGSLINLRAAFGSAGYADFSSQAHEINISSGFHFTKKLRGIFLMCRENYLTAW